MIQIERSYQQVPYHNKHHAIDVLCATEVLINQTEHICSISAIDRFFTLLSAACHDVAHPSVNNAYVFKQDQDATVLKTVSPDGSGLLEKCHLKLSLNMLKECNLFELYNHTRFMYLFEQLIMATDMSKHSEQVKGLDHLKLKSINGKLKKYCYFENSNLNSDQPIQVLSKDILLKVIIHLADLSNPTKDFSEAYTWAVKVCQEFFEQGDMEKINFGKTTDPLDREKTKIEKCQVGFITFCVLPMVEKWSRLNRKSAGAQNMKALLLSNKEMYAIQI